MTSTLRWKIAQKAEINWWKRYLGKKSKEEYLNWKKSYWKSFLQEVKSSEFLKIEDEVLEIGCGPAGLFTVLDGFRLTAIDPLLNKYEKEIKGFSYKDYPNVRFFQMGIEDLPSKQLDVIFCINVINHVRNLELGLENIYHSLKENGTLILSIDTHNSSFLKKVFRSIQIDVLHPHQYSLEEYTAMLEGYEIEVCKKLKKRRIFDYWVIRARKT